MASETPESLRLIVVAPLLGWNSDVMLNCSVAMLDYDVNPDPVVLRQ
jgi:hypothetical protein